MSLYNICNTITEKEQQDRGQKKKKKFQSPRPNENQDSQGKKKQFLSQPSHLLFYKHQAFFSSTPPSLLFVFLVLWCVALQGCFFGVVGPR